jgi:hypothetical protein
MQSLRLKNGREFRGMPVAKNDATVQFYDLSVTPPPLRRVDRSEIAEIVDNRVWNPLRSRAAYTAGNRPMSLLI